MSDFIFEPHSRAAIIGCTGGIGTAVLNNLIQNKSLQTLYAFSRSGKTYKDDRIVPGCIDLEDEKTIEQAASRISEPLDFVFIATGVLHGQGLEPEKALRDIDALQLSRSYQINAIGPALIGKHFLPLMNKERKSVFAALSARVGSTSDNNDIGGWYAYRASKAALNMILKNFSIEMGRKNKNLVITGLQPGTVDTELSKPFQGFVDENHLFTPEFAASSLLNVLNNLEPKDSGKLYDWQGEEFAP